jgi:hypothetical protein
MESICKMAILHLSIRPSEPCIHFRHFQTYNLQILQIELGLRPSEIKIFFIIVLHFLRIFRSLLSLKLIQWYILVVHIIKKRKIINWSKKKNGGQNQDGRQAWIFHDSVNFYANQLKLWIWKEILKNIA